MADTRQTAIRKKLAGSMSCPRSESPSFCRKGTKAMRCGLRSSNDSAEASSEQIDVHTFN
jgi:hypothetical protein